jgi:hypothetical protein
VSAARPVRLLASTLAGLALAVGAASSAAEDADCPMRDPHFDRPPIGTLRSVKGDNSWSYFLRGGGYVNVVTYHCLRFGQRIYLFLPAEIDKPENAMRILKSIVGTDTARWFQTPIDDSMKPDQPSRVEVTIPRMEAASVEIQHSLYEGIYLIEYYRPEI